MSRRRRAAAAAALVATLLTLGSSATLASPYDRGRVEQLFRQADANDDGALSPQEFEEARLGDFGVSFESFDANSDGRTTMGEYFALFDRFHPGGHQPEL